MHRLSRPEQGGKLYLFRTILAGQPFYRSLLLPEPCHSAHEIRNINRRVITGNNEPRITQSLRAIRLKIGINTISNFLKPFSVFPFWQLIPSLLSMDLMLNFLCLFKQSLKRMGLILIDAPLHYCEICRLFLFQASLVEKRAVFFITSFYMPYQPMA